MNRRRCCRWPRDISCCRRDFATPALTHSRRQGWRHNLSSASTGVPVQKPDGSGPPLPHSALPPRARGGVALAGSGRSGHEPQPPGLPHLPFFSASSSSELHPPAYLPSASGADRPWRAHHAPMLGVERRCAPPQGMGTGGGLNGASRQRKRAPEIPGPISLSPRRPGAARRHPGTRNP